MPIFLYCVGTVVLVLGAAMIGYGIPNNEFGIGNTLIVAGTTAFVGGLILVALGMAVQQLQRMTDALATRAPIRSSRPFETFDPAVAAAAAGRPQAAAQAAPPARVPFPPKTRPESRPPEPRQEIAPGAPAALPPVPDRPFDDAAPTLANPDEPPVPAADEAFLSPLSREPEDLDARAELNRLVADTPPDFRVDPADLDLRPYEPDAEPDKEALPPPAAPRSTYFDAMWPEDPKAPEPKADEFQTEEPEPEELKAEKAEEPKAEEPKAEEPKAPEPKPEPKVSEFRWANIRRGKSAEPKEEPKVELRQPISVEPVIEPPVFAVDEPAESPELEEAPRATVAILKSGVVDGMGYTLYVDGSIEAELPQGTLRFASINELRSHLEKTA